ncbi:hypothetical protein SNE40_020673 [Patella caerulea]|uniref:Uncharacterized protein n=1 Tax=Patella caerulea TaxID=87958 RepID=A0AAN8J5G8_PATCE
MSPYQFSIHGEFFSHFDDPCHFLKVFTGDSGCPKQLADNGLPCTCPFKPTAVNLPSSTFTISKYYYRSSYCIKNKKESRSVNSVMFYEQKKLMQFQTGHNIGSNRSTVLYQFYIKTMTLFQGTYHVKITVTEKATSTVRGCLEAYLAIIRR